MTLSTMSYRQTHVRADAGVDPSLMPYGRAVPRSLSPTKLVLIVIAVIFLEEMGTLLMLGLLPPLSDLTESVLDASLLVLLVVPALYWFHLRPMQRHAVERDAAMEALEQAKENLSLASQELAKSVAVLEKTHREDALVAELVELLQSCRSTKESVEILRLFGAKLFPNDRGSVYVYRASRNLLELAVAWGEHQPEVMLDPEDCWALRRGRLHVVGSTEVSLHCTHLGEAGAHTICVPMMAQGEATGVLMLRAGLAGESSPMSADTVRLAPLVAEQVALALSNLDLREKLRDQAIRDPLTGLFNRRYFEETAEREMRRAECRASGAAIIMIDVDYFKRFNDTHGHEAGDAVLKKFAILLQSKARAEDIACRYGGEEFALLLSGVRLDVACARATEIRDAVKDLELRFRGETLGTISVSCGVAAFPDHGQTLSELMAASDRALYSAKAQGRDRVLTAA